MYGAIIPQSLPCRIYSLLLYTCMYCGVHSAVKLNLVNKKQRILLPIVTTQT